jgi:hypothetical protein
LLWSSKDNSNEHVGCFGLGSKAPFSYTTEFTVTCWKDGRRRTYTCVIGHDGKPKVILMENAEDTEEPTGVMVSFPVKKEDIYNFQHHVQEIARPYRPVFKANIDVSSAIIAEETPYFYAVKDMKNGPFAQIGPVWYAIDTKHEGLTDALGPTNSAILRETCDDLVFKTPIGAMEVTSSAAGAGAYQGVPVPERQ